MDGESSREFTSSPQGSHSGGHRVRTPDYVTQILRELDQIREDISKVNRRLDDGILDRLGDHGDRLTRLEETLSPIKKLVWGLVGIVLTAVIIGMLSLVVVSGSVKVSH